MLYKHKKTGGTYLLQMLATNEADLETTVIYSDTETGTLWSRPASEFFDGRFVRVPTAHLTPIAGETKH